jgi:transposase InsO family protein
LPQAQAEIQAWRDFYNHLRPLSSLGNRSPVEFAEALRLGKIKPDENHPEILLQTF